MKKRTINVFVLGAVVLTLALFGCSSGNVADTTAPGAAVIDGAALYTSDCSGCHGPLATSGKKGASVSQIQNAIAHNWGGMGAFAGLTADQLQAIATALAPVTTTDTTNTPATAASLDGAALYADKCSSCHGSLATSGKGGVLASAIQAAIANNSGGMGRFSNLTTAQLQAIADALATVQAQNPVQTPPPGSSLDGAALYATYCSSCHSALATSSKTGRTADQITAAISSVSSMNSLSNLTATHIQAIAAALGAGSSSTPSPLPAPSPTTTDGATLYATSCSSCHGSLAASSKVGRTAAQITAAITSVSSMNSLSNLTPTQIQAIASVLATSTPSPAPAPTDGAALYTTYCSSCHGSLAASSKVGRTAAQITAAITNVSSMNSLSNLTSTQIQAIASVLATSTPTPTPAPTDGAALYTTYCSSCHGSLAASSKVGKSATQIQTAITNNTGGMGSLSNLTSTQVQAIASALAAAPTPAPTDGAALYTNYCGSCHGALASSNVRGSSASTISSALSGVSQMSSISLTAAQVQAIATALETTPSPTPTPTPTPACGSCHAIPPATGRHSTHQSRSCSTCHGTGYSSTAVNTATHQNGTINIVGTIGWNATTRSCSNSCHGTQTWGGSTTPAPSPTPAPTTTDGATLYGTYCASCHGPLATSNKSGATAAQIQTGITNNLGGMGQFSNLTSTQVQAIASALATAAPAPAPACGSCHAIPPGTGHHDTHRSRSCSTCHGTGYSSTTVNTATHQNGVVNIASGSTPGWNPTTRTCSNSCHGTERW